MGRPTRVELVGQPFRVEWPTRPGRLAHSDLGAMFGSEQLILVRGTQASRAQRETLLHEVIHALLTLTGHGRLEDEQEPEVQALGVALLDALRRNPEFVEWLTEPEAEGEDSGGA